MEDRFRKPQTAAGSEPKSRKTKKRVPPAKKTLVSKSDLGRPLPKASNSSRIRAQVPQNRNRKNCRNVAYKTHSKEKDKKRLPPAKKTLVSKSDLGRPLPKASNSSRIRAQVTQNRKPQKLPQRRTPAGFQTLDIVSNLMQQLSRRAPPHTEGGVGGYICSCISKHTHHIPLYILCYNVFFPLHFQIVAKIMR